MKSIMVVDDSQFMYEEMEAFLEDSDYEVKGFAKSGEEALELYEKIKPDIVTMDIILPGIDGLETTRKILEKWPDAKVLVISSLAYDDTIEEAEGIGAKGFIYKPFEKERLLTALDKSMED